MKKIGIILVNYKDYSKRFLHDCRNSLRAQTYPAGLTNIYIIDNASSDETRAYLADTYPEALILPRLDGNYAAANNTGIERAKKDDCEYIVIANMDTVFDKNWLLELARAMDENPQAGIAQSKILLAKKSRNGKYKKTDLINAIGNKLHFLGFGYSQGSDIVDDKKIIGYPEIIGYASGCSFIIRAEILEEISGYNEEYFMYHDDTEVSLKTRLAGYKIILAPLSVLWHKYEFSRNDSAFYQMEKNRFLVFFSLYSWKMIILFLPAFLVMDIGIWAFAAKNGWLKTKWRAFKYVMSPRTWRAIKLARRQIKPIRKITDKELARHLVGKVLFQGVSNFALDRVANPVFSAYLAFSRKIL